jgi:hypothetical protein
MNNKTTQPDRFLWRPAVLAVLVALFLFVPIIISGDPLLQIAYFFLAAPIIGFFILIAAIVEKGRRRAALLSALVVFGAFSWSLFRFRIAARLHPMARWLLWSKDYKAQFCPSLSTQLECSNTSNGSLGDFPELVTLPSISFSTRAIPSRPRPKLIPAENSVAYPVKSPKSAEWRANITPSCFTPTPTGPTATRDVTTRWRLFHKNSYTGSSFQTRNLIFFA